MSIIALSGLTKKFDAITVVDNISFEAQQGQIFGLVGPDGAGKTTTIRMLAGIMEPTSGTATVDGRDIAKESEQLKEAIGYMSQRFGLYEDLTVIENINFYADIYCVSKQERPQRIKRLFDFSGLEPFQKRLARNLSGGMKQKLGLACSLIHTPKVLFLDEPTAGVDPVSRREFWRILYELIKEGVTILFSTSYLEEAERCGKVALIHKGKLLRCDNPENIKKQTASDSMEEAFISTIKQYEQNQQKSS
jgi:ABC-2 type transport system ATP-binding protein